MLASTTPLPTLEDLRPQFRQRLQSMYSGEPQPGTDGPTQLDKPTRISQQVGMWIYQTYCRLSPKQSLEVGLAYGFSTIYILAAIDQIGAGRHISIDPFQTSSWHRVGAYQAKHLNMERSFELLQEFSATALARFAAQGTQFEFIFIDGSHRFDDVLVDFTLAADLCPVGGNIILDDMWMPSIQTLASWIRLDRKDFREVPTPFTAIVHFERIAKDDRNWDHFVPFCLESSTPPGRFLRRIKQRLRTAWQPGV